MGMSACPIGKKVSKKGDEINGWLLDIALYCTAKLFSYAKRVQVESSWSHAMFWKKKLKIL